MRERLAWTRRLRGLGIPLLHRLQVRVQAQSHPVLQQEGAMRERLAQLEGLRRIRDPRLHGRHPQVRLQAQGNARLRHDQAMRGRMAHQVLPQLLSPLLRRLPMHLHGERGTTLRHDGRVREGVAREEGLQQQLAGSSVREQQVLLQAETVSYLRHDETVRERLAWKKGL